MRLTREFYQQEALVVAEQLLGKLLVRKVAEEEIITKIVETEAYIGPEDKACHAYQNKRTKRTKVMFKQGGYAYVYLIYGIHNCFNVVSGVEGKPEAVLVRAVEPVSNLEFIKSQRDIKSKRVEDLTNGPGKLSQALEIDRELNGYDLTIGDQLYIKDTQQSYEIEQDTRINIDYAEEYRDKLWRFYIKNNSFVSK
ncbi:DNA-3-methyladenine glycosylase [Fuchsiella alkaliacetigena]|uniref:DNA-3-methyladenine glycosylase n=1 Tax=Fuchsiella alkaliacetigena TaxID=957042 RepID=UPI00200B18D8|nr:DNA-3-methyladenine glycosylase [Fuchsiella alkaliacetigena]MCK8825415.1 DNA-3-methyladenine glycosylase [Fuchsiella alkaliacetigena]